jgi:Cys-tRNA(Pro) deacylase
MKTPATQFLDERGVKYAEHHYEYVEHGGAQRGAEELGVPAAEVVKTLVMQDEKAQPLLVLMHGHRKVSTKNLARQAGRKSVEPCRPEVAQRHTGYQVGGTSPFGTRKALPIYMERSIADLPAVYINGGRRGLLLKLSTQDLIRILDPRLVDASLEKSS